MAHENLRRTNDDAQKNKLRDNRYQNEANFVFFIGDPADAVRD